MKITKDEKRIIISSLKTYRYFIQGLLQKNNFIAETEGWLKLELDSVNNLMSHFAGYINGNNSSNYDQ